MKDDLLEFVMVASALTLVLVMLIQVIVDFIKVVI
jgi:hypothetical protein